MIYEEILSIIKRWKEQAKEDKAHCLLDERNNAAHYMMGKEKALSDVIELLTTSDKINKPWEE